VAYLRSGDHEEDGGKQEEEHPTPPPHQRKRNARRAQANWTSSAGQAPSPADGDLSSDAREPGGSCVCDGGGGPRDAGKRKRGETRGRRCVSCSCEASSEPNGKEKPSPAVKPTGKLKTRINSKPADL
jgi:hypothetical protein